MESSVVCVSGGFHTNIDRTFRRHTMSNVSEASSSPSGTRSNFGHPQNVLHTINFVSGVLAISLMTPFVLLRMYIRTHITGPIRREDCK